MPLNLLKKYPELLDFLSLTTQNRTISLRNIFNRDIVENATFSFKGKQIYPIKTDGELDLGREFMHLTTHVEIDEEGIEHRAFDKFRSERLHWIRSHVEEKITDSTVEVFSVRERDSKKRQIVTRTYIYNSHRKYVVVLEPYRNGTAYYLLTAYYLDQIFGEKKLKKSMKHKLDVIL